LLTVPIWVWAATLAALAVLVAVDFWHARKPHAVGFREAAIWSAVYVGAAVVFAVGVWWFGGRGPGLEFTTGYLVEKALSVDNLFIFALILGAFAVPERHRSKVLLIGVLGALVMRVVFIAVGASLLERFAVLFLLFGLFLIYTAVGLLRNHGKPPNVVDGRLMRWARRKLPITDEVRPEEDGKLLVRRGSGRQLTALGLTVLTVLTVDVVFALDSIPAIFGITENVYLVVCTNAFALLGLRALYFLLIGLLSRLKHLHYGLAGVLALIGVKLSLHYLHKVWPGVPEVPTWLSLGLIVLILGVTTVTSLRSTRDAPQSKSDVNSPPVYRS
jgi:tellurite resistance protein TerC